MSPWRPAAARIFGAARPAREVRRIAPACGRPCVTRQKTAADAHLTMRFGPVKGDETRGAALRERLIRQRAQALKALPGPPGVFGLQGAGHAARRIAVIEGPDSARPADCVVTRDVPVAAPRPRDAEIGDPSAGLGERRCPAIEDDPGQWPLLATARATLAPPGLFRKGRDVAAWLSLTPRRRWGRDPCGAG